jgi:uncharacterized delta-60 repeat protein
MILPIDSFLSGIRRSLCCLGLLAAVAVPASATSQVGAIDPTFAAGQILSSFGPGVVLAAVQTSNGLIIAGDFASVSGISKGNIARLTTSGDLDLNFASGAGANGPIHSLVVESSGTILVGGDFTMFDGQPRNRLARLSVAGTIDLNFNPGSGLDGVVHAIAVHQGAIFVGGDFTMADSVPRNSIASFDGNTGSHLSSFNPGQGVNGPVYAITADSRWFDNRLYLGGSFTSYNGSARNRIVRIHSSGQIDTSFQVGAGFDGPVYAIALDSYDRFSSSSGVLVGGDFNFFDGVVRSKLARLTADSWSSSSRLDPTFKLIVDGPVRSVALSSSNHSSASFFIGGDFSSVDGASISRIARVVVTPLSSFSSSTSTAASVDGTFNNGQSLSGSISCIAALSDTRVVIGGTELVSAGAPLLRLYGDYGANLPGAPSSITAQTLSPTQIVLEWVGGSNTANYRVEFSSDGGLSWDAASSGGSPYVVSGLSAGSTYRFRVQASNYNGLSEYTASILATTLADEWAGPGSVDQIAISPNSTVRALANQPDGKIIAVGSFTSVSGTASVRVVRLSADMSLDTTFNVGIGPNSTVNDVAVQPDGKVLIVGSFSQVAGIDRRYVARLNADGSLDTSFDVGLGPNSSVEAVAFQADGKILVGGWFSTFDGYSQDYVARLNHNGSLDLAFRTTANSVVYDIQSLADGRFYIAGSFSTINGLSRRGIARIQSDGSLDTTFDPGTAGSTIRAIAVMPSGSIILGGNFSNFSGTTARYLVRLSSTGQMDESFALTDLPNNSIEALAIDGAGRILIGGYFTKIGESYRPRVARLLSDGSPDPSFDIGAGANSLVSAILVQADSRVVLGGSFTSFGNSQQRYLARILGGDSANPLIVTDSVPVAVSGQPFNFLFRAAGGTQPYSWVIVSGRLPRGLEFSNGMISGVATESITTTFTLRLVDADSSIAEKVFHLESNDQPASLQVVNATYGAGSTFVDVTEYVQAFISGPSAALTVSNSVLGGDPVFGQVKTLWVTYQNNTGRYVVSAREGTLLSLPNSSAVRIAVTFDEWRSTKFSSLELYDQTISGPYADPDGDGVPNILESAFGGDPLFPDAEKAALFLSLEIGGAQMRFICDSYQADLTYEVQVSDNLVDPDSWIPVARSVAGSLTQALTPDVTVSDSAIGIREVTVLHAVPAHGARFYRVMIQWP